MRRILKIIFLTAVVVLIAYQFRNVFGIHDFSSLSDLKSQILTKYFPCKEPIPYKLGTFDNQFNLSQKDFIDALSQAEAVWEKPSGLNLFVISQMITMLLF